MVLSLYLNRESSDFNDIWCADANFGSKVSKFCKATILKIVFWLSQWFIVQVMRNLVGGSIIAFRHRPRDQNTKFQKFKMVDGRHFENGFIAISLLRIIRFQWNLVCRRRFSFQERSRDKVSKFCKFKIADDRHIENRFWQYLNISLLD